MNIEKTISEQAVSDILTPMLESQDRIVTEDVAPLFDEATGLDTPPASGTVTTTIEESRSVISAIIRKAWTATLTMLGGASVIGYITAAYTYLRNRLQGNETYGIPDRRSEISASSPLAANLALLNDRKIGGVPEAEDGMSLAHLLCSTDAANAVTEIVDDNTDWTYNRDNFIQTLASVFPNMTKLVMHCSALNGRFWSLDTVTQNRALDIIVYGCKSIRMPQANQALFQSSYGSVGFPNIRLWIYGLEDGANIENHTRGLVCGEFYIPDYKRGRFTLGTSASYGLYAALTKIYAGCQGNKTDTAILGTSSNSTVVDFEIGDGACQSISFTGFSGLTAENMYNHILCRLKQDEAGCGSGVTITLGTTNIEKLEAVEEYNTKLTELEDTYGYTFA